MVLAPCPVKRGLLPLFCVLTAGAMGLAVLPETAYAQSERRLYAKRYAPKRTVAADKREKTAKPPPGPVLAVISIAKQRVSVYGSTGLLGHSAVSTGQAGHRTPTGVFSVIQKNRWHRSNIYSGAPMPYMQRITWSGVALHAGVVPGYPASHGCIRLPHNFAVDFWGMTKIGARVVVAPDEVQPAEVAHAQLPAPTLTPAPAATAENGGDTQPKTALVALSLNEKAAEANDASPTGPRLLNPMERARAAKAFTAADAAAKAKAAKLAVAFSAQKAAEANKAIAALRNAELAHAAARSRLDAAIALLDAAKTPEAVERAKATVAAAEAKLTDATKAAEEARAVESVKTPEAFTAARAAWDAESMSTAAAGAAKAAERGIEPISIFISKKTGRLYVRQAWAPIHEAPVTIKDAEAPIGTHLYLAVEPIEDGKTMRWLSVSMPSGPTVPENRAGLRRGERAPVAPPAQSGRPQETAASVLDRVEIPEETRKFISDKLWTGASLILSDQGISHETGVYTDFIVLTR